MLGSAGPEHCYRHGGDENYAKSNQQLILIYDHSNRAKPTRRRLNLSPLPNQIHHRRHQFLQSSVSAGIEKYLQD